MTIPVEQACPLCDAAAKYEPIDYGRAKHFLCSAGCEYIIYDSTEARLKSSPQGWRDELSKKAGQRKEGHILVIRRSVPPQENVELTAEFLSRKEWIR